MQNLLPREVGKPTYDLLAFHLQGSCLGFLSLYELCQKGLWPLCNVHLENVCSLHIYSQRYATTIQASFVILQSL